LGYAIVNNCSLNLYVLIVSFQLLGVAIGIGAVRDYLLFHPYRLFTTFGKPIYMSAFLPFFFCLNFAMFCYAKERLLKTLGLINVLIFTLVIVWHASRLIWISTGVTLLFMLITNFKNQPQSY